MDGQLHVRPPAGLVGLLSRRRRVAPIDLDFHTWVARDHGDRVADQVAGVAGVFTFTADPGSLSAAFVWERLQRATNARGGPSYVRGGWGSVVRRLVAHAGQLNVRIETEARVGDLPSGPVVVATSPAAARPLLGRRLDTPAESGHTALLDAALVRRSADAYAVSDLDDAGWIAQYSLADPTLAPVGQGLFQVQMPVRSGESGAVATNRAEALLDLAAPAWRKRVVWQRSSIAKGRSGALDRPGYTWRDRPAISQGDAVFLAGDEVAAPGLLSEVSVNSAVTAASAAVHAARALSASTH